MEITLRIDQRNGIDHITYVGPINEESEVHLARLVEKAGSKCIINLRNVEYVNSCGVRAWVNFMREFEKNRTVALEECPDEIVMQINMIPSFKGSAKINSVYASYHCHSCSNQTKILFEAGKNLPTAQKFEIADVKCPKCQAIMEMDEIEDEYFSFVNAS